MSNSNEALLKEHAEMTTRQRVMDIARPVYSRTERRLLKKENEKWPLKLMEVPELEWRTCACDTKQFKVWRSRDFLVQAFNEPNGVIRLSVNKTIMLSSGRWDDGLSWDELQKIKQQAGYGDRFAIEIYPEDSNIINVANMRHLWLLPEPLNVGWKKARSYGVE